MLVTHADDLIWACFHDPHLNTRLVGLFCDLGDDDVSEQPCLKILLAAPVCDEVHHPWTPGQPSPMSFMRMYTPLGTEHYDFFKHCYYKTDGNQLRELQRVGVECGENGRCWKMSLRKKGLHARFVLGSCRALVTRWPFGLDERVSS